MKMQFQAIVNDVYVSDKGAQYLTMVEVGGFGSVFKLSMGDAKADVKRGSLVEANIEVSFGQSKAGSQYMRFEGGSFKNGKSLAGEENPMKGDK